MWVKGQKVSNSGDEKPNYARPLKCSQASFCLAYLAVIRFSDDAPDEEGYEDIREAELAPWKSPNSLKS